MVTIRPAVASPPPIASAEGDKTRAEKAQDARTQAMKDAVASLKAANRSQKTVETAAARRAAAKMKIERLKKQLDQLALMGLSPKQRAQMAARLAKELGQAAKEYGAAGPSGSLGAAMPLANNLSVESETEASQDAEAQAKAAVREAEAEAQKLSADSEPAAAREPEQSSTLSGMNDEDRQVLNAAKRGVALAKAIIEREARKADPKDLNEMRKVVAGADREIDEAVGTMAASVGATVTGYTAAGPIAAPAEASTIVEA